MEATEQNARFACDPDSLETEHPVQVPSRDSLQCFVLATHATVSLATLWETDVFPFASRALPVSNLLSVLPCSRKPLFFSAASDACEPFCCIVMLTRYNRHS